MTSKQYISIKGKVLNSCLICYPWFFYIHLFFSPSYHCLYKRNSTLEKFIPLFMIGWDDWFEKRFHYLSSTGENRDLIDICCIGQNAVLFVSLLWNLFCLYVSFSSLLFISYTLFLSLICLPSFILLEWFDLNPEFPTFSKFSFVCTLQWKI